MRIRSLVTLDVDGKHLALGTTIGSTRSMRFRVHLNRPTVERLTKRCEIAPLTISAFALRTSTDDMAPCPSRRISWKPQAVHIKRGHQQR